MSEVDAVAPDDGQQPGPMHHPVHLKDVLRDIQTDRANLIHGWLLSYGSSTNRLLAHRDAGGGAIHSIKCGHSPDALGDCLAIPTWKDG
jgi:GH15 family glucan-1,4-alpha-glucosidase